MRNVTITPETREIKFGDQVLASWTIEAQEDLKNYHGIDIKPEIITALLHEVDRSLGLNDEEADYLKQELQQLL